MAPPLVDPDAWKLGAGVRGRVAEIEEGLFAGFEFLNMSDSPGSQGA
jgi:hypothetical protein